MVTLNKLKGYDVVFLSAGLGNRMGKIGKDMPKSLLKIRSKTIIFRLVDHLASRGLEELNIILGFKYKKILKELNKIKNLKINFSIIKDFKNNGSAFSWYQFKNLWKKKKPLLVMHTDIILDNRYIDNILYSRKENIVGVKKQAKNKLKKKSFIVKVNKKMQLSRIDLNSNLKEGYGEILCVNKFSIVVAKEIFKFMKKFFIKNGTHMTWEYVLDDFIRNNKNIKINVLKNQNFDWVNVNEPKDLSIAKKKFN